MSIFSDWGIEGGKDRMKEEALYNLASCYALLERKIGQTLSPFGLSPVKMNALMMVKHVGGERGLSQVEISKRMIVSAGNITRLIDRLEKDSLVERVAEPNDRRVKLIRITKKGSDLLDSAWPTYQGKVNEILTMLPSRDLQLMPPLLNRFREKLVTVSTSATDSDHESPEKEGD